MGNIVLKNLFRKQRLLKKKDKNHKKLKTALVILGGGMRGAYGAGVVTALEKAGLNEVFDVVVGVSAGCADAAYFLADQSALGSTIWYEDLSNRKFINLFRLNKIMDLDLATYIFEKVKPLNVGKIRSSRSRFYGFVTNAKTGKSEFLNMKDKSINIIDAIIASSAIPVIYNRQIKIKNKIYCDGSISCAIPIEFTIRKGCTDILVIANSRLEERREENTFYEKLISEISMRKFSKKLKEAVLYRNKNHNESLRLLKNPALKANIQILYPRRMQISPVSINEDKVRETARKAENQTFHLLSQNAI